MIMNWQWIILMMLLAIFLLSLYLVRRYYRNSLLNEINRAQRSERIKTVFMANVSHALRAPLNAIISDSQKIVEQDDCDVKQVRQVASDINQNGRQLMYFISQLLELSNFESSMASFTMIEVNLAELMASYRREAQRDANPEVTVIVRSSLSPHCKGVLDTNLMYQLMMHLLHNASSHTKEGTITIQYEHERKGLKVSVIDTGDGQSQNFQANFSALIQDEQSLNLFNQNSGLGLSICKSIVEGMKGYINLSSEPGKGSTVSIWIPCKMRDMKKGVSTR